MRRFLLIFLSVLFVGSFALTMVSASLEHSTSPILQENPTEIPTITNTPGPTNTPTNTPLPPIPEGALTATVIRAGRLFTRQAPYLDATPIKRIINGETYAVIGRNPDATWFLLELGDSRGWAWGYYLFIDGNEYSAPVTNPFNNFGDPANTGELVVQTISGLRLRQEPDLTSPQVGSIDWGAKIPVIARSDAGEWFQVVWKGTPGWILSAYTQPVEGSLENVPIVQVGPPGPAANPPYDVGIISAPILPENTPSQIPQIVFPTATPPPFVPGFLDEQASGAIVITFTPVP